MLNHSHAIVTMLLAWQSPASRAVPLMGALGVQGSLEAVFGKKGEGRSYRPFATNQCQEEPQYRSVSWRPRSAGGVDAGAVVRESIHFLFWELSSRRSARCFARGGGWRLSERRRKYRTGGGRSYRTFETGAQKSRNT